MARTGYALGNPRGIEKGPILIPDNTEMAGIEAAEQFGFGLVDLRLHFRNTDGSSIPGSPITGWATGLAPNANNIGTLLLTRDEVIAGLVVVEQFGYGVVNLRMKKRRRNGLLIPSSGLIVANQNQNRMTQPYPVATSCRDSRNRARK